MEARCGADREPAVAACPVTGSEWVADEGTVGSYRLRGAGAVRGDDGKVLTCEARHPTTRDDALRTEVTLSVLCESRSS